ncbi:RagB/SusD family nutrient uptake outer membrane protein [Parapedobacter deserti]|uniref:RagB/SusD family nutrient uptake outer membrane protein n=1 Tax=Parapedobacter deserti TaxID=1912957 RepID=A0ABV7JNZ5_9SPHI
MKRILYITMLACTMTGCERFLDTESYDKKNTGNFPRTAADAEQMITGIYSTMSTAISDAVHTHFYMAELASDDRFGGGGDQDRDMQGLDHLMNTQPNRFQPFWRARYQGIFRANTAIETLDNVTSWASESQRNQLLGEAHFLRALFFFELAQMFGEVPLTIRTEPENLPKAPAAELYAQIGYDLKQAISLMPSVAYSNVVAGHATKWAAQALAARVFLFYTGYYNQTALPVANDGGEVSKQEVIAWLNDCINNSGHGLVSDFRNLWPYTNPLTTKDYDYDFPNMGWEGDGNRETVFAVKFGNFSDWGQDYTLGYSNQYVLHFGMRSPNGQAGTFPFGQGWGAGPVNSNLWSQWRQAEPNDLRRAASIIDAPNDLENYVWGADNMVEETGFWQKKYMPVTAYDDNGNLVPSYAVVRDGSINDFQRAHTQDLVLIRFADVLLMHAELTEDATRLNQVRRRVSLPEVAYSLDALKRERRWELAFEGQRWFDLMRWHDAAAALATQEGVPIRNKGADTQMRAFGGGYRARYEATGGFWPIPQNEIDLSDGVLTQNPGWGTPAAEFPGW